MNTENRKLVLGALDSLAVALADHEHEWTVGERAIYEEAIVLLGQSDCQAPSKEGE